MDLILAYDYYKNIYLFMILGKCGSVIIRVRIIKKRWYQCNDLNNKKYGKLRIR